MLVEQVSSRAKLALEVRLEQVEAESAIERAAQPGRFPRSARSEQESALGGQFD